MRSASVFHPLLVVAFAIALAACGGSDPSNAPSAASATSVASAAPETSSTLVSLAADADGATIYQARCASCHGENLRGTGKGPSQLSIVYEPNHHSDFAYRSAIQNGAKQHHWGFGDMPAVEDITDDQTERVIAYIRAQQEALGFER